MRRTAAARQSLFILLIAILLTALYTGGLWAYVKSADAETGVQETSIAKLPEENKYNIIWEKYDQFPPIVETKDISKWTAGFGLMRDERDRLIGLKAEYEGGRRPDAAAPTMPSVNGFAILPLDPANFGGMSEYYFLPETLLTDEQLLQLIAYSCDKGVSFTPDMLTEKNSTRGDSTYPANRLLSAGEEARSLNLALRAYEVYPACAQQDFSLPVTSVACFPLKPDMSSGASLFVLLPLRALTDEEMLGIIYRSQAKGYTRLDPAKEKDLNLSQDIAQLRALLEDICLMPMSASQRYTSYVRKESTGEIRLRSDFESALINGQTTGYSVTVDYQSRQLISLILYTSDKSIITTGSYSSTSNGYRSADTIIDPKWMDIAKTAIERFDSSGINKLEFIGETSHGNDPISEANFSATMKNGGSYLVNIRYSDGAVVYAAYAPEGQNPWESAWETQW